MKELLAIPETIWRKALEYWRKLWLRVLLFGVFALLTAATTQFIDRLIPSNLAQTISGDAADRLLNIIANAMLAVTIFSLTVMVNVYRSSSSQFTPRVHRLIMQDSTTQNTLATFIGTYVYALTAILMRELDLVEDDRAFTLFWVTVAVLAFVVWSLVRWTLHLQTFGSLMDTTRQVERLTREELQSRASQPCLDCNPLRPDTEIPEDATPIVAKSSGFLDQIYQDSLQEIAEEHELKIYVWHEIGTYVLMNEPIAQIVAEGELSDEARTEIYESIELGDVRTYHQDPRFGLLILSEIASKALSPGINDPGTAIDICNRVGAVLSDYKSEDPSDHEPAYDRVWFPPLKAGDLIKDGFSGLARDGANLIEVQERLQKILFGLMRHPDEKLAQAAEEAAERFSLQANAALTTEHDKARLKEIRVRRN